MKESQTLRVIDRVQEEYGTGGTRLLLKQKSSVPPRSINREQAPDLYSLRRPVEPGAISHHSTIHQTKTNPERDFFLFGEPGGTRTLDTLLKRQML